VAFFSEAWALLFFRGMALGVGAEMAREQEQQSLSGEEI